MTAVMYFPVAVGVALCVGIAIEAWVRRWQEWRGR